MALEANESLTSPKVIVVSHGFGYGNDLMYYGEIFRALSALLHRLEIVIDREADIRNPYALALAPMLRMFRLPLRRTAPGGQAYDTEVALPSPLLVQRLAARGADVLVTIEFTPVALMAVLAAMLGRRKLVLLVESDPVRRGASRNRLVLAVKRWAVRRADVIQTNDEAGRRYLIEDLGADPSRVRVAPYLTSRPPGPTAETRAHDGPLRLLFANSINARKGLREFVAALALLPAQTRNGLALTVVGDGPERAAIERDALELGLGNRLQFVGRRRYDELGPYYAAADVLVNPSLADYRSLSTFEGLGYGLAILSSVHDGATAETVRHGVNGFVVDPHDAEGFAQRIEQMAADRTLVARQQTASLELYQARFSLERVARNIADSVNLAMSGQSLATATRSQ